MWMVNIKCSVSVTMGFRLCFETLEGWRLDSCPSVCSMKRDSSSLNDIGVWGDEQEVGVVQMRRPTYISKFQFVGYLDQTLPSLYFVPFPQLLVAMVQNQNLTFRSSHRSELQKVLNSLQGLRSAMLTRQEHISNIMVSRHVCCCCGHYNTELKWVTSIVQDFDPPRMSSPYVRLIRGERLVVIAQQHARGRTAVLPSQSSTLA